MCEIISRLNARQLCSQHHCFEELSLSTQIHYHPPRNHGLINKCTKCKTVVRVLCYPMKFRRRRTSFHGLSEQTELRLLVNQEILCRIAFILIISHVQNSSTDECCQWKTAVSFSIPPSKQNHDTK